MNRIYRICTKLNVLHEWWRFCVCVCAYIWTSEYLSYKFRIVNRVINVLDSKATNLNYRSEYHDVSNGNNYGK